MTSIEPLRSQTDVDGNLYFLTPNFHDMKPKECIATWSSLLARYCAVYDQSKAFVVKVRRLILEPLSLQTHIIVFLFSLVTNLSIHQHQRCLASHGHLSALSIH